MERCDEDHQPDEDPPAIKKQVQVGKETNGTHDKPEDEQQPEREKLGDKMKQMKSKDMEMKMMPTRTRPRNVKPPTQYGS